MARYIDEKDVYKLVEPTGTAKIHCSQIDELPRADVVPKSEVERLQSQVNRLKKYDEERDIALHARLISNEKAEVAREIFEEIEEFMIDSTLYKMPSKVMLSSKLAELKKKYIPQECPTCKHFVGCKQSVWTVPCEDYEEETKNE